MRLKRLSISNFKGLNKFTFEPDGKSANIYGANATGKTTIADALSWLLFDKDTQDRSPLAFGIKTLDENGNPLHGEEHSVEAEFITEDQGLVLKKVFKEKWTTSRGSSTSNLTGHTTDYYWDEEPVKAGDYTSRLADIMGEETFKMLTLPNYFAEIMHWTDRREILTRLCGDISDEDIMAGNPELSRFLDMLDGKTKDAREKILRDRRKKLNDELNSIPDRIDENQLKIVDVEETAEAATTSITKIKEDIEAKREKITQLNAGGGVADMQVKIQEIEAQRQKAKNENTAEIEKIIGGKRDRVQELRSVVDEAESNVRKLRTEFTDAEQEANQAYDRVKKAQALIDQEKAKQPEPPQDPNEGGPEDCPMCERPLPEQDPAEAEAQYNQYVERFNSAKAEELKKLNAMLEDANKVLAEKQAVLEDKKTEGLKAKGQLAQRQQALEKAEAELKSAKLPGFDESEWEAKKQAITQKIEELRANKQQQVEGVRAEIQELESQVDQHKKVISQHQQNKELRDRIAELKEMMKRYGADLDQVDKDLMLIEDYNRAKANYITDRVNDLFEIVNWRLFKEQVNGGLTETADPVVGGVPFGEGLNNAARIAAGLDIISTLSKHFENSAPVFVDNAEAVVDLPEYNNMQVIALYVSGGDSRLRVELEEEQKLAVA